MAFKKSRILPVKRLGQLFRDSAKSDRRFCFILGAGASVESGIPSGKRLEMDWMNWLMGEHADRGTPPANPEQTRELAEDLCEDKDIAHSFEQLEAAWKAAKSENRTMASKYYSDLYALRFHPEYQDGYRYMESLMENKEPSPGYRALALLLTDPNRHNLVITTNFDTLVEDALFLHTDQRPLVISHEALADYIKFNTKRPIIVKVHRGLMYDPFNSRDTTRELKPELRKALDYAMQTYTPVVIGYGGGDGSLMAYLKETTFPNGIYWCYRDSSGLPDEEILDFLDKRNGHLVRSGGFDALMYSLGSTLYGDEVGIQKTRDNLERRCRMRTETYSKKWTALEQQDETREAAATVRAKEQKAAEKRAEENLQTFWDICDRALQYSNEGSHQRAVDEYTVAIAMDSSRPDTYNNRGNSHFAMNQYDQAIEDYKKVIELDPRFTKAYYNLGSCYAKTSQHNEAIRYYNEAISQDPNFTFAFYNRGISRAALKQHEQAILDYDRAVDLDPYDADAFIKRGDSYAALGQHGPAIQDYGNAIKLKPLNVNAFIKRGDSHAALEQYAQSIRDYSDAISLDPDNADLYYKRGSSYEELLQTEQALQDYRNAIELDPSYLDKCMSHFVSPDKPDPDA